MPRVLPLLILALTITSTARGQEEEAVRVFQDVHGCVVSLENLEGSGTGIVLDRSGLILTNAHVIASPLPFRCRIDVKSRGKSEPAVFQDVQIVGVHPVMDLALVRVNPAEHQGVFQPAVMATAKALPGQRVYAIGNPAGGGGVILSKTITEGILSGVDRVVDDVAYYQISAPINPGNSGGPLCDKSGKIIGLVTLKFTDVENVGFAIPLQGLTFRDFIPLTQRKPNLVQAAKAAEIANKLYDAHAKVTKQRGINDPEAQELAAYSASFFRIALSYDPGNAGMYYNVGMLLRSMNEDKIATAYLLQALQIAPWPDRDGPLYYRELGLTLAKQAKTDAALVAWQEGLAKFPAESAKIWEDVAICWIQEKRDYYEAALAASTVLHLKDPSARLNVATQIRDDAVKQLNAEQRAKFDDAVRKLPREMEDKVRAADKAKRAGKPHVNEAFASFVKNSGLLQAANVEPVAARSVDNAPVTSSVVESDNSAPAMDLTIPAGSRDMLADVDVKRDAVFGRWSVSNRALATPISSNSRLQLPTELPGEYDLTLIVERNSGGDTFVIGFVREGVQSVFYLDANLGNKSGLDPDAESAYRGELLPKDQPATIVCKIRREGLLVTVNGMKVFFQRSDQPFAAVPEPWAVPDATRMFVGASKSKFTIHKLMLTESKRKG